MHMHAGVVSGVGVSRCGLRISAQVETQHLLPILVTSHHGIASQLRSLWHVSAMSKRQGSSLIVKEKKCNTKFKPEWLDELPETAAKSK